MRHLLWGDELYASLARVANQLYNGLLHQGSMIIALQNRSQMIEEAAVPTETVETLRGLCQGNDQELKAHIGRFQQEVAVRQAGLRGARKKAEDAFAEVTRISAQQQQVQQNQMVMIAQEIQKQSGDQVQQALQTLEQHATVACQELEGQKNWMGGHGVSLKDWAEQTTNDFNRSQQEVIKRGFRR